MIFIMTIGRAAAIKAGFDHHGTLAAEVPLSNLPVETRAQLAELGDRFDQNAYDFLLKKPKTQNRVSGFSIDGFLRSADLNPEDHPTLAAAATIDAATMAEVFGYAFKVIGERRQEASEQNKAVVAEISALIHSRDPSAWLDYFNAVPLRDPSAIYGSHEIKIPASLVRLAQENLPSDALDQVNEKILRIANESRHTINDACNEHPRLKFLHRPEEPMTWRPRIQGVSDPANDTLAAFRYLPKSPERLFDFLVMNLEVRSTVGDNLSHSHQFHARDTLETLIPHEGPEIRHLHSLLEPQFMARLKEAEQLAEPFVVRIQNEVEQAISKQRTLEEAAEPYFERYSRMYPGSQALQSLQSRREDIKGIEETVRAVLFEPVKQWAAYKPIDDAEIQRASRNAHFSKLEYTKSFISPFTQDQTDAIEQVTALLKQDSAVVQILKHCAVGPQIGLSRPFELCRLALSIEIQALGRSFSRQLALPLAEKTPAPSADIRQ